MAHLVFADAVRAGVAEEFVRTVLCEVISFTVDKGVLEKNNFFACQFHPEKSGTAGELILKRFLNA